VIRVLLSITSLLFVACAAPRYAAGTPKHYVLAAADVVHEYGMISGHDGVPLFTQSWRPKGEAKAALVVVHGLKGASNQYGPAAEQLARDGYAVHALDLRGHGNSEGRRVWVDPFADYVADVHLFMGNVRKSELGKRVFLFGHSMGGTIVTQLAMAHPRDLDGLLLCAAALTRPSDVNGFKLGLINTFSALAPRAAVLEVKSEDFSRDPAVVAAMDRDPLVYQGKGPARTAARLLDAIQDVHQHMERLASPVLIMHGSADQVTALAGSRELQRRASSADKTLKVYPGHYHALLQDLGSDEVLADMTAWMDARVPQTRP